MKNLKNIKSNFKNAKNMFNKNVKEIIKDVLNNWNIDHSEYVAEVCDYSYSGRKISHIGVRKNNIGSLYTTCYIEYKFNNNFDYYENIEMLKNYLNEIIESCYDICKNDIE